MGDLQFLSYLNLAKNQFSGKIPPQLGKCNRLERLNLSGNRELGEGTLPPELGNCSSLRQLVLDVIDLSEDFPTWLGNLSMLEELSMSHNWLHGTLPQMLMESLPRLLKLDVSSNRLQGSIPTNMSSRLQWLDLSANCLVGGILDGLGGLFKLRHFDLRGNWLRGGVPAWVSNLTRLRSLSFVENDLTGAIPPDIGRLVRLQELRLPATTGKIPAFLGTLTELRIFDFRGSTTWRRNDSLLPSTTHAHVHQVDGRGGINFDLPNLTRLIDLCFWEMSLTGRIPDNISHLAELEILSLSGNQLSGQIPLALANLSRLEFCNLDSTP